MKVKKQIYKGNILNFIFLTFASLFETAAMIILSLMLERVLAIATTDNLQDLYHQGVIFIILGASFIIVYLLYMYIKPRFRKRAMMQYKNNIYNNLLKKNITDFNKHETSTYISSLTNDVNYIEENYIFSIFSLITQITLFITTIVVMLIYNPILSLVAIGLGLLPLIVALIVGGKLMTYEEKISNENASFMHFLKDNLIGFSTIKVFKAEKRMKELFNQNNNSLENQKAKKVKTTVLMEFLQTLTSIIAQYGVFFIGAYLCIKEKTLTPSVILLFVQLMNYVMSPLAQIPSLISKRNACIPLFKKIENIINEKEEDNTNKEQASFNNNITVSDLHFSYDDKVILNGVNYTFNKNKSYAIVGTSGSGKTTLINLLLGRNNSYQGSINYDNKELNELSIDSIYEISSFVEQNVFIFDDTIINNITMYSKVDEDLLNKAINQSGLKQLIDEKGIDYRCGENGNNLSGGEKQRISIARALIKKAQILLMDEATSALDNETSYEITNNVLDLENTTKIMITHRLEENILKRFDEIIVLKNGLIVENGNFETLIDNNGLFKSLYELSK